MNKLRLAIDLDDVCAQWTPAFAEYLQRVFRVDIPEHTNWNYWEELGISKQEFDLLLREFFMEGGLKRIQPVPGAVEALSDLHKEGHRIHLITARAADMDRIAISAARKATEDWILGMGLPPHSLTFTADKLSINADLILDDNLDILTTWSRRSELEIGRATGFCFDRPWNQSYQGPRVYNWIEFAEAVRKLSHPELH